MKKATTISAVTEFAQSASGDLGHLLARGDFVQALDICYQANSGKMPPMWLNE
jgi:hypothetical protein